MPISEDLSWTTSTTSLAKKAQMYPVSMVGHTYHPSKSQPPAFMKMVAALITIHLHYLPPFAPLSWTIIHIYANIWNYLSYGSL